jgi:serine/threonine-protein kinase
VIHQTCSDTLDGTDNLPVPGQNTGQPPVSAGQVVGRWELVALAAEGSWARIYRARPAEGPVDRLATYALKMPRPERRDDPAAIGLLAREALAARSVSHRHLIAVLEAHVSREPRLLVMPWLEGATLQAALAGGRRIDLSSVLWIARQVAEALEALDAAGWMHGDLKPGNIFLSPEGHVTLLDLGFARRRDETGPAAERRVMGTAQFLAPECASSTLRPDIRSDIYSLGVVLYELLAGRPPLAGDSVGELARGHKQTAPPSLVRLAPNLPTAVAHLVHRMLAKDPLRRPQTPRELTGALVRLEIGALAVASRMKYEG